MTDEPRYNVNFHNDADIAAAVDQNVPRELISERSAGNNNTLSYLKGDIDVDALNRIFGPLGWGMVASPPQIDRFEDKRTKWEKPQGGGRASPKEVDMVIYAVTTQVTLTIKKRSPESSDTVFTQTGVGYGEVEPGKHAKDAIGMAVKGAETDGLKRCCTMLGKAFGMFLNADGSQSDIEYAHRNNAKGLASAKRIRSASEDNRSSNRNDDRRDDRQDSRDAGRSDNRNENRGRGSSSRNNDDDDRNSNRGRNNGKDEDRDRETQAPKNESRAKSDDKPAGGRKRPTAEVNDNFDLDSEPITRDDQIAYGATFVRKLNDATNRDDRIDLVKRHRDAISNLDAKLITRIKEQAQRHDIDIDKV